MIDAATSDPARNLEPPVTVLEDADAVAAHAAEWLLGRVREGGDRVAVCLSGGSTPKLLYERLAEPPYVDAFPWPRVHWFWGDERFVPADDERSNARMVRAALIGKVPIPQGNVHAVSTHGTLEESAAAYEALLKLFYGGEVLDPGRPLFDATLLGLGEDGHTASLFPGKPAVEERKRWVVPVPEAGLDPHVPRVSLTLPALESSRHAVFLVAGAGKRGVLARVRRGDDLPAARVRPAGALAWFVDRAAAPEATS